MNWNFFQLRSIKTKTTIYTLAIFLIGIWSLAFYASRMLHEDMHRTLAEQQYATVTVIAANINRELDDRLRSLEKVAGTVSPGMMADAAAMQKFLEQRPVFQSLFNGGTFVTRLDGTAIADVSPATRRVGINYSDRDYMIAALKGKSTISQPVISKSLNTPVLAMAVPFCNSEGNVVGALVGVINLGMPNFLDRITVHTYGKTGGYLLVAPQYRLIVTATDKSRIMEAVPPPGINPLIDRFVGGYEGSAVFVSPTGQEVLASTKSVPVAGWFVVGRIPTKEAYAPTKNMQFRMVMATIFFTLLAGGMTWWMLKHQLAPMLSAVKTLSTLANTDQTPQPLPIIRQDEIGQLIGSFNSLLETLQHREESLREHENKLLQQNDELLATEEVLRVQINEFETSQILLQEATTAAESANYAKSQFLDIMSHELRTPINGVSGMAQLLEMTELSKEQREYVKTLKLSSNNLTILISDILELSKLVDGKLMLEQIKFGLRSCIAQVVDTQRPHAVAKDLDFICTVSPDVPDALVGDPLRLRQILLNLLGNAVKFTEAGSLSVTARVKERQSTTMILELAVQDTGIGIAPDKLKIIFAPFIQVDGSRTRKFGGAGLGLTLCKRLVELMGGGIRVESTIGQGSLFRLLIPFAVSNQVNPETVRMIQSTKPSSLESLRVLVAEDNPINAQFMMLLLTKLGHTATCVVNGMDALAELKSASFDLILMDIQMPVMNGIEALQAIRQLDQCADIPVIALTAFAMTEEQESFMSEGFNGYIPKPVEIDILVEEIERVILTARRHQYDK